jgi:hypothetical protein
VIDEIGDRLLGYVVDLSIMNSEMSGILEREPDRCRSAAVAGPA